jgi:hypothetical protein
MAIPLPFYGVLLCVRRSEQLWQSRLLDNRHRARGLGRRSWISSRGGVNWAGSAELWLRVLHQVCNVQ